MGHQKIIESVLRRLLKEDEEQEQRLKRRLDRAMESNMAAYTFTEGGGGDIAHVAVLYNASELMMYLDEIRLQDTEVIMDEIMLGVIGIYKPEAPCNGAWQIAQSAIKNKGDGGVLYDVAFALSPTGILIPDRYSVSPSAKKGWKQQNFRRTKTLDDIDSHVSRTDGRSERDHKNHTDDPSDDCTTHAVPGEEHVDMSYEAKGHEAAVLQHLKAEHEKAMQELEQGVDKWTATSRKRNFIKMLEQMTGPFFKKYYKGGTV